MVSLEFARPERDLFRGWVNVLHQRAPLFALVDRDQLRVQVVERVLRVGQFSGCLRVLGRNTVRVRVVIETFVRGQFGFERGLRLEVE